MSDHPQVCWAIRRPFVSTCRPDRCSCNHVPGPLQLDRFSPVLEAQDWRDLTWLRCRQPEGGRIGFVLQHALTWLDARRRAGDKLRASDKLADIAPVLRRHLADPSREWGPVTAQPAVCVPE